MFDLRELLTSPAIMMLENDAFWPYQDVFIAAAAEMDNAGSIVPYTLGNTGIHVERLSNGSFVGRINRAQYGGCSAIPMQCQTGTKTACPQIGCGLSLDGSAPITQHDVDYQRRRFHLVGQRGDQSLTLLLKNQNGILSTVLSNPANANSMPLIVGGAWDETTPPQQCFWRPVSANWKLALHVIANMYRTLGIPGTQGVGGATFAEHYVFPNLVFVECANLLASVIVQPTATSRSLCRVVLRAKDRDASRIDSDRIVSALDQALQEAAEKQRKIADGDLTAALASSDVKRQTISLIAKRVYTALQSPLQRCPKTMATAYPLNPRSGLASG